MSHETIDARLVPIIRELLDAGVPLLQAVDAFEKKYILTALERRNGKLTATALDLGIHRNTLMLKRPVTPRLLRKRAQRKRSRR